jgi:hypothetical protein
MESVESPMMRWNEPDEERQFEDACADHYCAQCHERNEDCNCDEEECTDE